MSLSSYYNLPSVVENIAQNSMGTGVTLALQQYWHVLMLGCQVMGFVVCADALIGLYKKERYNNPHFGEYKIPLFIVGVLLFNMSPVIDMVANTLGIGQQGF